MNKKAKIHKNAIPAKSGNIPLIKRLGFKLSVFMTAGILLVGLFSLIYVSKSSNQIIEHLNSERSQKALSTLDYVLANYETNSQKAAGNLADDANLIAAVSAGDADAVRSAASDASDRLDLDVDFITITDADGNVIARTHSDKTGDSITSQQNISNALSGKTSTFIDQGTEIKLSMRTGVPIKNVSGKIIGVVSTGYSLVKTDFVDELKTITGDDFTVFIGDERVNTTIINNGERVVGTKLDPKIAKIVIEDQEVYMGKANILGAPYATAYEPIVDSGGNVIGVFFAGSPLTSVYAEMENVFTTSLIVVLLLLSLVTAALIVFTRKSIVNPLANMSKTAHELSRGNLNIELLHTSNDELGVLADALRSTVLTLQSYVHDISDKLHQMSNGDMRFDVTLDYVGDFAPIKAALVQISGSLNKTLSLINTSADQVDNGARLVAASSTSLAHGAAEQAGSVQELTASLEEITSQTEQNAKNAQIAAELTKNIQTDAQAGSVQMSEMLSAMKDINVSSDNISKIIKVINDIAFQTNILALNAAVEAARAGEHGKGFAVVADEVRTLAAKSASAANETTELIEGSVGKAAVGTRIANQTAASLGKIVSEISKATDLIGAIASASNEQALALEQVNQGIMQVSQIVQSNAASSEECAAASEELSDQADNMKESVSVFRLKA